MKKLELSGKNLKINEFENQIKEILKNQLQILYELSELKDIRERSIHIEERLIHVEERLAIMDEGKTNEIIERLIHIEDKINESMIQENDCIYLDFKKIN